MLSRGLRRVTAGAPLRSCVVATSCHRGRAPLRQPLAVAPLRPAALQRRSFDLPWHTSRAEIVRLRDVPINRDAGEVTTCVDGKRPDQRGSSDPAGTLKYAWNAASAALARPNIAGRDCQTFKANLCRHLRPWRAKTAGGSAYCFPLRFLAFRAALRAFLVFSNAASTSRSFAA